MIVIGLTGGIASGKSTISRILKEYKIPVVDADIISKEIIHEKQIINKIINNFGFDVLDISGEINRKALAKKVFGDKHKLNILNSIMHPEIKIKTLEEIDKYKASRQKLCAVDAPLLIEAGFVSIVKYIIIVYISCKLQKARLVKRDNISERDAEKRINSQMKFDDKVKYADFIIDNSGTENETKSQVMEVIKKIESMEGIND
jgi:dephospho-CoA kinase